VADAAFARNTRVWFLGSRLLSSDWALIAPALKRPGWQMEELPRQNALSIRLWRAAQARGEAVETPGGGR